MTDYIQNEEPTNHVDSLTTATEVPATEPPSAPTNSTASRPAQARLVKIKFRSAGRHYDFNALALTLSPGDKVIVETDRGRALGTVVSEPREASGAEIPEGLKNILRHAVADDLTMAATFATRERDALRFCRDRVAERKMDMKLVRAEYLFDGSKIIFYFTADGRVDFRELVKDLAHYFHTRIEMRQIGVRDEAKLIGGIGVCGRELCCSSYLTEFAPVSVKMAKEQGLALNPTKISGQCGRLLCCLAYEYDTYCDLKKSLPKCGRKVMIEGREGEVIDQHLLRQTVTVAFSDQKVVMSADEIEKGIMPHRQQPSASGHMQADRSASPPPSRMRERSNREQQGVQGQPSGRAKQQPQQGQRPQQQQQPPQRQAQPERPQPQPQKTQQQQPKTGQAHKPIPQQIKSVQQQPAQTDTASGEGRRKRHRHRRRSGRKPDTQNSPESGE